MHYIIQENIFKESHYNLLISLYGDNLKIEYCIENNIPLYIIKYDEKIDEKIKKIIK